jgi:hypothetical protein
MDTGPATPVGAIGIFMSAMTPGALGEMKALGVPGMAAACSHVIVDPMLWVLLVSFAVSLFNVLTTLDALTSFVATSSAVANWNGL